MNFIRKKALCVYCSVIFVLGLSLLNADKNKTGYDCFDLEQDVQVIKTGARARELSIKILSMLSELKSLPQSLQQEIKVLRDEMIQGDNSFSNTICSEMFPATYNLVRQHIDFLTIFRSAKPLSKEDEEKLGAFIKANKADFIKLLGEKAEELFKKAGV